MKKPLFTSLILIFIVQFCYAQNLDSLWKVFNNKNQTDTNRLEAINAISWSYIWNNPDTAIILANQELKLAQTTKQKKYEASALNTLGNSYSNKGDFAKALQIFLNTLQIFEEIKYKKGIAGCYGNIGEIYRFQSNYPKALEYDLKALKVFEELRNKRGIGACYGNIGIVYQTLSNYSKALEYYFKDLKIAEEIGDKRGVIACYSNIGNTYRDQLNYPKALEYAFNALKMAEKTNDIQGVGNSCMNIGATYQHQANYPKAMEYFFKSLQKEKEIGDREGAEESYVSLAELHNKIKNYKKAIEYCDSALQISKEIGDVNAERITYQNLATAYSKTGNYKEAYENHLKFKLLTDSIFNVENSKQLGDMKTNFEVEKKETELKAKADAQQTITAEEEKRQVLIIYAVAGVLLIVIIFSALLYKRFRLTNKQKQIIEIKNKETEVQKHLIEEKHREITDSINYAERIQRSFIATKEILDENLKNYFVLFKPKDVVSGDFYWSGKLSNGNFALATADSTGHGVPGAIMSLLNITSLEKAIEKYVHPADILNATRKTIIERLKKDGSADGGKDGMDASLTVYDFKNNKLIISAANNPVWISRGTETIEIKPDKMPVGKHDKDTVSFTQHEIQLQNGDVVYTLTDGFPDQFGGEKGKKFMSKNLRELLSTNAHLPMNEQKELLEITFKNWAGSLEQVDDVTIIGIKI
jgi:serine phosphatase RsbU (regulator of sigma subunit)